MSLVTLRIKRRHMDSILEGKKKVEYRAVKPYYTRLLTTRPVTVLKLHYQQDRQALVEVLSIEKIKKPDCLVNIPGEEVYALQLGQSGLYIQK